MEAALGIGKGRLAGTTASPKSMMVGVLRLGVATVEGLPEMLLLLGEDHPVRGEPMGWGEVELGRLMLRPLEDEVRVGAGRPLTIEVEPEVRDGVEVRVGVAVVRVGMVEGREAEDLELVRVGDELTLRDGVERVEGLDRRTLVVRCGAERLAVDRCEEVRCEVVRCEVVRELVALEEVERWTERWAGSGWTARESEPLKPTRATAAAALIRRRARLLKTRLRRVGRHFMGFSVGGRWGTLCQEQMSCRVLVHGPREAGEWRWRGEIGLQWAMRRAICLNVRRATAACPTCETEGASPREDAGDDLSGGPFCGRALPLGDGERLEHRDRSARPRIQEEARAPDGIAARSAGSRHGIEGSLPRRGLSSHEGPAQRGRGQAPASPRRQLLVPGLGPDHSNLEPAGSTLGVQQHGELRADLQLQLRQLPPRLLEGPLSLAAAALQVCSGG